MNEQVSNQNLHVANEDFTVTRLVDGLGFGHGAISRYARETMSGNEDLSQATDEAMRSRDIIIPVGVETDGRQVEDDGCIDGREVADTLGSVVRGSQILGASLHRPKVPGGGLNMVFAARVGMGLERHNDFVTAFDNALDQVDDSDLEVGAHTDNHAHGVHCGCTALDKPSEHFRATQLYRPQIASVIELLTGSSPELQSQLVGDQVVPGVFDHFAQAAQETAKVQDFSGRLLVEKLIEADAVVKTLADDHRETRIGLNFIPGTTIDQSVVRDQTNGRAQVFAYDVWRLGEINEALYDNLAEQRRALVSQLVYSLGITAVLTKGDLAVDVYR